MFWFVLISSIGDIIGFNIELHICDVVMRTFCYLWVQGDDLKQLAEKK